MLKKIFKILSKTIILLTIIVSLLISGGYLYLKNQYYTIPVLMYHHVSPLSDGNIANVTPERFKEQMEFIKKGNYEVIGPYEFLDYALGKKERPSKKLVMITFDDGYRDNYAYAYEIIKNQDFPAVIFMVVNKIGKKDYLTINDIKKMQSSGIIFGSHTLNETYLPALTKKELKEEIIGSKIKFEMLTEKPVHFFAYCTGGYTEEAQEILKDAGYLSAFTTNRGFDKSWRNDDLFAVRRIKITDKDSPFKLWAKLTGIYQLFHRVRNPY